ncbi:hypothetical protein SODALDRAFT_328162 [Sodiomyces alkalinus F11]|uniref:Uncharacterized protein n=1 Tax=Sodiomyces alkalinus (strain CBS 110278 / VKM F-3762 / F11) TaxID=1314773 RepID=A0A3N2PMM8_SODAK|nr:hypothetical protein SODALDRAFT_328162 [Sodiomyces alkalinus F11]ROT35778.1 hypothetical protein SODALDRAFT_328162 [Sodiomyces alkalinus F11]
MDPRIVYRRETRTKGRKRSHERVKTKNKRLPVRRNSTVPSTEAGGSEALTSQTQKKRRG